MLIKTIIDGKETIQTFFEARTRGEAREIVMALGLCMETDPIPNKAENCWEIYCKAPRAEYAAVAEAEHDRQTANY